MQTVEEIRAAAIAEYEDCLQCKHGYSCVSIISECPKKYNVSHYQLEALAAITGTIPLSRLSEICSAEKDGRVVVMPPTELSEYGGLKVKYRVYKAKDNAPVENCFVLRPAKDPAAIQALMSYAVHTENRQLAADISAWIEPYAEAEKKGGTA